MGAAAVALALLVAIALGCGGNGGGSSSIHNQVTVVANLGPANNVVNGLFTSVTVCVPGTSNCQTLDNILVDTGSFGLRLLASQVTLPLTIRQDANGHPLGECLQFVSSFNWGPVVTADIQLAGEKATSVPMQLLGQDGFVPPPTACTSSGLPEADTQATLGANGILGVGVFRNDCGPGCASAQAAIPNIYFGCPTTGCVATAVPETEQVQNPVALFPQDNNGIILQMPSVPDLGTPSASGTMTFGIGTQTDNTMNGVNVLLADGFGNFSTSFQGTTFNGSILDTGSNANFFLDSATTKLPLCADGNSGFYCPSTTTTFSATNNSASGTATAPAMWAVANAVTLFNTGNAAFANLGGPSPGSFDFGLSFFFGRTVFVGLDGATTGTGSIAATGPFYAY